MNQHHEYLENHAPEALAYAKTLDGDDWEAQDAALETLLAAKREAAVKALAAQRCKPYAHTEADDNASEMVIEACIDPDSDAGRLLYLRAYVAISDLL